MNFTFAALLGLCSGVLQQSTPNPATTPANRLAEDWWKQRHEACVSMTKKGGLDLIFIGDSITQGWEGEGRSHWAEICGGLTAGNFGFSGDRTEHVIWRLQNGEILGLKPKVIVMMIGTNNIGHGSSNAEQTASGVTEIVKILRKGMPQSKILLLGIFPRGANADDPMFKSVKKASELFSTLHDGKDVFFEDIGYAFVRPNGELRSKLMPDLLHLNDDGYGIWAQAVAPMIAKLAKQ